MTWCGASRSPGQHRRKQHDQQRPEIVQKAGFGRRREAQREEIQRVIAEQPADPDDPRQRRLPQRTNRIRPPDPGQRSDQRADRERHRGQLERPGSFPVATVSAANSDHIRIAVSPIRVAVRGVIVGRHSGARVKRANPMNLREAIHPVLTSKLVLVATHPGMTKTSDHTIYCPPLIESVEPVMAPASSAARNTTARAISSGSPRRLIGISGRMLFSSTSFGTACTISVLI